MSERVYPWGLLFTAIVMYLISGHSIWLLAVTNYVDATSYIASGMMI